MLVLQIQPDEGISLEFEAKQPGPDVRLTGVRMDFHYADWFKAEPATGYETLIYDCLTGDQTLFNRGDDIEFAWRAVMPFLNAWEQGGEVHALCRRNGRAQGRRHPAGPRRPRLAAGGRLSMPPPVLVVMGVAGRQDHHRQGAGRGGSAGRSRTATPCIRPPTSPR